MSDHVLTTNGMGYFWCSCDPNQAHVLWSLNEHIAEIARGAGLPEPSGVTVTQWAVKYGADEPDEFFEERAEAIDVVADARSLIRQGIYDADDYEPMTVVSRQRTTFPDHTTDWQEATP